MLWVNLMNVILAQEKSSDYHQVEEIIRLAFEHEEFSDKTEHQLVANLRNGSAYIPELSLVAKINDEIIGHILFTRAQIVGENAVYPILVLAPVAVKPNYQGNGVGHKLIHQGLELALKIGFSVVSVMGHPDYYKKFGFKPANEYGVKAPFEISNEYYMLLELVPNSLNGVSGVVKYAPEFGC